MSVDLWRIATDTPNYTATDTTGVGAKKSGGRWNRAGTPVLYAATSIALAALETIVHLGAGGLPLNRYLVRFEVPDGVWKARKILPLDDSTVGWDALPAGKVSLDIGEAWLRRKDSVLLVVPSIVIPEENNVLINPLHSDSGRIAAHKVRKFVYDGRVHG